VGESRKRRAREKRVQRRAREKRAKRRAREKRACAVATRPAANAAAEAATGRGRGGLGPRRPDDRQLLLVKSLISIADVTADVPPESSIAAALASVPLERALDWVARMLASLFHTGDRERIQAERAREWFGDEPNPYGALLEHLRAGSADSTRPSTGHRVLRSNRTELRRTHVPSYARGNMRHSAVAGLRRHGLGVAPAPGAGSSGARSARNVPKFARASRSCLPR